MSQVFRFPTLNKVEQHQTLQERLDAAQRIGWQSGYEKGLEQGAIDKQIALEQEIDSRVETLLNARLESEKQHLIDHFNVIFEKTNNELSTLSTDLKSDITLIITKLAEFVIDGELILPSRLIYLINKDSINRVSNTVLEHTQAKEV